MLRPSARLRRWLPLLLAAVITANTVSCGTILYPERRGQPAGRLDAGVVVMDGLLLLLFFIPGVVAFVVDFSTGAIYLPPDCYGDAGPAKFDPKTWRRVDVEPADLTPSRIESVVREQTGRDVRLEPGAYEVQELRGAEITPVGGAKAVRPSR